MAFNENAIGEADLRPVSWYLRDAGDEIVGGLVAVRLDTCEFQARPFYERHGYTVYGVLDRRFFESLILEGAQAGLSWSTILKKRDGSFDAYVWRFVGGAPKVNERCAHREIPASTEEADALSRAAVTHPGTMFWFMRNKLWGSYFRLTASSRS